MTSFHDFSKGGLIPVSPQNPLPVTGGTSAEAGGLGIPAYDYLINTYTDGNITETVYKTGGAAGTVVATLTYTYDGSGNLLTVTKS